MTRTPSTFSAALLLILLNALFWLGYAVILLTGIHPAPPPSQPLLRVIACLAIMASVVLIALCLFLRKRNKIAFYFSLAVLGTLVILSLTDELGAADLVYIILTLIPLMLLLANRKWYFEMNSANQ